MSVHVMLFWHASLLYVWESDNSLMLRFFMGAFGGTTSKPSLCWSNDARLLQALDRPFDRSTFKSTVTTTKVTQTAFGKRSVSGTKELKGTQWPPQLCTHLESVLCVVAVYVCCWLLYDLWCFVSHCSCFNRSVT